MQRFFKYSGLSALHRSSLKSCLGSVGPWREKYESLKARNRGHDCLIALIGPRGTGKTQLAAALLADECRGEQFGEAREIKYFASPDELSLFLRSSEDEEKSMARLVKVAGLCIDEFHELHASDFMHRTLTRLIDRRYGERKLTILIANQTIEAFGTAIGASAGSRMMECGMIVECNWRSFRASLPATGAGGSPSATGPREEETR